MSRKRMRSNLKRKFRLWIALYQHEDNFGYCHWCKERLMFIDATFDHEPALSEGGNPETGVIACERCNKERGKESDKRVKEKKCDKRVSLDEEIDAAALATRIMKNSGAYRRAFKCPRCGKWHISVNGAPTVRSAAVSSALQFTELDQWIQAQWEKEVKV